MTDAEKEYIAPSAVVAAKENSKTMIEMWMIGRDDELDTTGVVVCWTAYTQGSIFVKVKMQQYKSKSVVETFSYY